MPRSTHEHRALKKSQHLIFTLYSLCTEEQISVIGLSPTAAPLWVMVREHLSCQDSLSALRASIRLQFGLENPNLALEFCYSQSFQGFCCLWQSSMTQAYPTATALCPGGKTFPSLYHGLLTQDSFPNLSFCKEIEFPINFL